MPTHEFRQRVEQQLEELYQRHLLLHDDKIVGYYKPRIGYTKESTEAGQKRFAICLATTDGEVFCAGDHDWPFALQSISKVFVYGLALEAHGRDPRRCYSGECLPPAAIRCMPGPGGGQASASPLRCPVMCQQSPRPVDHRYAKEPTLQAYAGSTEVEARWDRLRPRLLYTSHKDTPLERRTS